MVLLFVDGDVVSPVVYALLLDDENCGGLGCDCNAVAIVSVVAVVVLVATDGNTAAAS